MKKPDIFKRAEKFLGRSFPFETKCVGCGFPIKSFKFVNYQELGPTMCDDCGEKSDQKRIADDKLALQRELALQCGVDDAYRTWDREQANLLGNGALLKLIGEKKKDLGSIWVWGGNGKGKSHCAGYAAYRMTEYFFSTRFYAVNQMLEEAMKLKVSKNKDGFDALSNELRSCDILVLDDFDKVIVTEAKCQFLYDLIDFREKNKKNMWFTSNIRMHEMRERLGDLYGSAIMTRVGRMVGEYEIELTGNKQQGES